MRAGPNPGVTTLGRRRGKTAGRVAELNAAIAGLAATGDTEPLRRELVAELMPETVACIKAGLKARQRWAPRLVMQAARLVGADVQVAVQIVQMIGAPLEQARAALERARSSDELSPHEVAEQAAAFLAQYAARHPAEYAKLVLPSHALRAYVLDAETNGSDPRPPEDPRDEPPDAA